MPPKKARKRHDHSKWLTIVSEDLGAAETVECETCGGTGKTTKTLTVGDVAPLVLPINYPLTAEKLRTRLQNPTLADLEHMRETLGVSDLETAASWSRAIAASIGQALDG